MSKPYAIAVALVFAVCAASGAAGADALLKPLPNPDLSALPKARADDIRDARAEFDKAKQKVAGDALIEAYVLIAAVYLNAGFYDAATVAIDDASALAPADSRWIYLQGVVARQAKKDADAQRYFERALSIDGDYLPMRIAVARSRIAAGDLDGARKILDDYVARHGDQAMPFAMLGEIALKQKRYALALEQTRRALSLQPNATALYAQLADAASAAGDAKSAADARAKRGNGAVALDDPLAQTILGNAAIDASAPRIDPGRKDIDEAAFFLAGGRYDAARQRLDALLKANPKDAAVLALYSRVEAAAGNVAAAKARAAAAVAADSKSAVAYLSQGVALEQSGDDAGAERAYRQAIALDANLAEARASLGNLALRTARNDVAIEQFRALVQKNFNSSSAWSALVASYVMGGQCKAALRDVSDFLARDKRQAYVMQLFVRLAATCAAASADEKRGALEYGAELNRASATAPTGEALALAQAANGKWDDAVKTQEAAMFLLVRNGNKQALPQYREFLQSFKQHRLPERPWPASAPVFHPQRPSAALAPPRPSPAPVAQPRK